MFGLDLCDILTAINFDCIEHLAKVPTDYDEAAAIFRLLQDSIRCSQTFYVEDGFCSEFVELQRDLALAYAHLAQFETDLQRKCCMLKNRIDILKRLLADLNPQHYLTTRRILLFELADSFSDMKDAKENLIKLNDEMDAEEEKVSGKKRAHWIMKCNTFGLKAIAAFEDFLTTFREPPEPQGKMPERLKIEENYLSVMRANFYMARIYSHLFDVDIKTNLQHLVRALELYQHVIHLAKVHQRLAKDVISDDLDPEVEIAKTMVELLPKKIDRIKSCL
ncbi:hypothetical protein Ciccas_007013 [Cichlidogyrus casuarinus]|uniref:KIF-binding protein n=1 Tax=Cichlidogyrus casuarinus TaxID=1844966 RepID=A0ABD2Q433_9PLAT